MTLDVNILRQSLTQLFSNPRRARFPEDAEELWAEAYHTYARSAEDVSTDVAQNLDVEKFRRELKFRDSRTVSQFAEQLDNAFVAYWSGTVFGLGMLPPGDPPCPNVGGSGTFSSEVVSVVVSVTRKKLLLGLLPVLVGPAGTAQAQASRFATVLDFVTKTAVGVEIVGWDTTPPGVGPLPIINLCTVF
jgi:hypothetical protein